MQSSFTSHPAELERKEPGIGGKPPLDRRPTGGGGGGGDDDWENSHSGPGELLQKVRFRVLLVMAGDMLLFAVLIAVFFGRQNGAQAAAINGRLSSSHPMPLPHILLLDTVLLLLSSLTVELARRNIFREIDVLEEWLGLGHPALKRALPWVGATLALGALFLGGQAWAWRQLAALGFTYNRGAMPNSYFFYLMTGLHAAHLMLGLLALLLCLVALPLLKRVEFRQVAIDATAWYWHTLCLAWILLLAVLAVAQ